MAVTFLAFFSIFPINSSKVKCYCFIIYNVNPTTAVKAISCLTEGGILYKRPGIAMCVVEGAREKIIERRKKAFLVTALNEFLAEANTLNFSTDELITLIKERMKNDCI
jgi:DNA-binding transcriptional regulator YhcF (GntR family)